MSNDFSSIQILLTPRFKKDLAVTIYSKADWSDIQNKVIEEIIKTFES